VSAYERIDRMVYRVERAIVVVALVVMALVVFLDVVHRSFAGDDSKFAMITAKIGGWFGPEIVEGTPAYQSLADASPWVLFVVFTWLVYFAIRSTKRATPVAAPIATALAVVTVFVGYGLVKLLLAALPNGLVWSQPLALVLTLWVGFVGASMCTYEHRHLRVEAVQRFLPDKIRPTIGFISGLLTTVVCFVLMWLSLRYVRFNYEEYVSTDGKGGLFLGMHLPKYLGFAALPASFAFMTIRFFVRAVAALRGDFGEPIDAVAAAGGVPEPDDEPAQEPSARQRPSDVPTEALPLPLPYERESSIDTLSSSSLRRQSRPPPSKVPTDAHQLISGSGSSKSLAAESGASISGSLEAVSPVRPTSPKVAVAEADSAEGNVVNGLGSSLTETAELRRGPLKVTNDTQDLPPAEEEGSS